MKTTMPTILLREFDFEKRVFINLKEIDVLQVPTAGDKITLDIKEVGYIFNVHDVHYADDNAVDVNIVRISSVDDYYDSKYPDIK